VAQRVGAGQWGTLPGGARRRGRGWTSIAGAEGEPVGNLHFAGEHTAREGQGYMEGGCESGERVAAEILAALGRGRAAA